MKENEKYEQWIKEMGEKLSTDTQAKAHFEALTGSEVGKELFRGGLREADYYRRLNEHNAEKTRLAEEQRKFQADQAAQVQWFKDEKPKNERLLSEVDRLQKQVRSYQKNFLDNGLEVPEGLDDAAEALTSQRSNLDAAELAEIKKKMEFFDQTMPAILGATMTVVTKIVKEGYDIDPRKVFDYAAHQSVDPVTALDHLTRDEREKREKVSREKEIEKAVTERTREALSKLRGPDQVLRAGSPSIHDQINSKEGNGAITNTRQRVDAAVADFLEITQGS